jgi:hypothetical protein
MGLFLIIFSSILITLETIKLNIDIRESLIPFLIELSVGAFLLFLGTSPSKMWKFKYTILIFFVILAAITFYLYSGANIFNLTSKDYVPEIYIWGAGYNEKAYLDIYKKFNVKRVVHFATSDCNEGSESYALVNLYKENGVDFIICVWFSDFVAASNSANLIKTWRAFKEFYLDHREQFGAGFYVAIDSEPPVKFFVRKRKCHDKGGLIEECKYMLRGFNRQRQETGAVNVQKFVDDVKSIGLKPMLVAMPIVLDDQLTAGNTLQTLYDMASVPPYNWDSFGYMIYRQDEEPQEGFRLGNHFVYSYGRSIKKLHGDKSNILLGVADVGPYENIDEIIKDVHIAKALEIKTIGFFSLETLLNVDGTRGLEKLFKTARETKETVRFGLRKKVTVVRHRNFAADIILSILP